MEKGLLTSLSSRIKSMDSSWDPGTTVFQPFDVSQSLLYEYAECLSVQTLLKICQLSFHIEHAANVEFFSGSGLVPVMQSSSLILAGFDEISEFVSQKARLSALHDTDDYDMIALLALFRSTALKTEYWMCWEHKPTASQVTYKRYGSVYPWPLSYVLPWCRQYEITRRLKVSGFRPNNLQEVTEEFGRVCEIISRKLGDKLYIFGEGPTELDAAVFGHLYTILTTELPDNELASAVKLCPNLVSFCQRIERKYFFTDDSKFAAHRT